MKNEKQKPTDKPVYSLTVSLQQGETAHFAFSRLDIADSYYHFLQANPSIGNLGVRSIERSWRNKQQ